MCSDMGSASRCCAYYSFVGALFMFWVGVMLTKQPFFVGGFEDNDAAENAKNNAFGAMGMFIFTFAVSLYGLYFSSKSRANMVSRDMVEMIRPLAPAGMSDYQVELPPAGVRPIL